MIKDKLYIDLTKHEQFEDFASQLQSNLISIKVIGNNSNNAENLSHSNHIEMKVKAPVFKSKIRAPSSWTEEEVREWFNNKKIKDSIVQNLSPCDGSLLEQLYITLTEVPEFFHSILRSDSNASLKDIVIFTSALKTLFK